METSKHARNVWHLANFLMKYPNQWHSVAKDAPTQKALHRIKSILGPKLKIVRYSNKTMQMYYHRNPQRSKNPRRKGVIRLKNGLKLVYLPANQTWMLLWHNTRVKGPAPYKEITDWMKRVYPHDETGPIPNPLSSKNKVRAMRLANKIAFKIYHHVKQRGFAPRFRHKIPRRVKKYVRMILRVNKIRMPKFKNPPDKVAARELLLYMSNNSEMYRQLKDFNKNLINKMARGVFRRHLAAKLFGYYTERAAKAYARDNAASESEWHTIFPKRTRLRVSRALVADFLRMVKEGNFRDLLYKKYRRKL